MLAHATSGLSMWMLRGVGVVGARATAVACVGSRGLVGGLKATGIAARAASTGTAAAGGRFEGQVAVVTGAGRDIGAATAVRLAQEGASVVVHYNSSREGADAVVEQIASLQSGARAVAVSGDLTTSAGVDALAEASLSLGTSLNVLVHNSGGLIERRALDAMDVDFLRHVMDVNFTSLFLAAQRCVPIMADGGAIVTLSSQAARDGGGPGAGAYAASKGAVHTYTRSLAKELAPRSIRVNTLTPGMIATGFHDTFTAAEVRKNVAAATLLKREGTAEEVAAAIAFFASSDASYLTGVAMDINGGLCFSG